MSHTKLDQKFLQTIGAQMSQYLEDSINQKKPVVRAIPLPQIVEKLGLKNIQLTHAHTKNEIATFIHHYLEYTTRLHHPGYIAHQVSGPTEISAIADYINGLTNNGMAIYEMGPAAVVLENFVIQWLLQKADWKNGDGVLVHGGSLANLTALLTARAHADPNAWKEGVQKNHIFFTPSVSHYSIHRTISIMGYGENALWKMPENKNGKTQLDGLEKLYQKSLHENKKIIALTCNACATATGLYDPIEELGQFCREKNIWFHVDGAHGASALLSEKYSSLMKGLEYADSMIWDMHKMLQTSALCAAVLYKNKSHSRIALNQKASYLQMEQNPDRDDLFEKAIECTKAPLGFRFFLNLYAYGESFFADYVDHTYQNTKIFYDYIQAQPDFECPFLPESNILLFRYKNTDQDQNLILVKLIEDGSFYITKTVFQQKTYLRLTVMNALTTLQNIQTLIVKIRTIA